MIPASRLLLLRNAEITPSRRVVIRIGDKVRGCREVEGHVNLRRKCRVIRNQRDLERISLKRIDVIQVREDVVPRSSRPDSIGRGALAVDGADRSPCVAIDLILIVDPHPRERHRAIETPLTTRLQESTVEVFGVADTDTDHIRVDPDHSPPRIPGCGVNVLCLPDKLRLTQDLLDLLYGECC